MSTEPISQTHIRGPACTGDHARDESPIHYQTSTHRMAFRIARDGCAWVEYYS